MDHSEHPPADVGPHGSGYETRDVNLFALMIAGVVVLLVVVGVELGLMAIYRAIPRDRAPEPPSNPPITLVEQLRELRHSEEEKLTTYGWVDRKAGVVRIPIERAMQLVAERGVPKGKGPRTEVEINSDRGTPVKAESKDAKP